MNKEDLLFGECTDKIMHIRKMFEDDEPNHQEIERILMDEVCPVICSNLHKGMVMFAAFHAALQEPDFMEIIYMSVLRYIEQNNLLKEGVLFNTKL